VTSERAIYERLGQLVRSIRQSRGLTQADLADRVGMSRTSVTNIESGTQAVTVAGLFELAEALQVDPGHLLPTAATAEESISQLSDAVMRRDLMDLLQRAGRGD
jgi:transcriptional regulator with XRE-family HTH domain